MSSKIGILFFTFFVLNFNAQAIATGKVIKIVDGDTFYVNSKNYKVKVRLIGIDAPESRTVSRTRIKHPMGSYAKKCLANLLPLNTLVTLKYDVQKRDRYKRDLAYVFTQNNSLFINEKLVEKGCAKVTTYPPNVAYQAVFLRAQHKAQKLKLGIWK